MSRYSIIFLGNYQYKRRNYNEYMRKFVVPMGYIIEIKHRLSAIKADKKRV